MRYSADCRHVQNRPQSNWPTARKVYLQIEKGFATLLLFLSFWELLSYFMVKSYIKNCQSSVIVFQLFVESHQLVFFRESTGHLSSDRGKWQYRDHVRHPNWHPNPSCPGVRGRYSTNIKTAGFVGGWKTTESTEIYLMLFYFQGLCSFTGG